jgi:hypothetical protein
MWLWDTITGKETERGAQLDAELEALNRRRLESGAWSPDTYAKVEEARASRNTIGLNAGSEVADAFTQGVADAVPDVQKKIRDILAFPFTFTLGSIPLVVWLAAAVALFFWMGGAQLLKGRLAK